jgi:hypothetical protein
MLSTSPAPAKHWLKSGETCLAALLLVGAPWLRLINHPFTLADCALWFGAVVLGSGLLRDLWALFVTRAARGEQEVAMCAESIVGAGAVAVGLGLVSLIFLAPQWVPSALSAVWSMQAQSFAGLLALALIFSAWVHDLVFVKRDGRFRMERHPDHGSFVVHLFRGKGRACALPPRS